MDKSWNPLKLSLKKWSNNHGTVKPPFPISSSLCLYTAISFLPVLFGRQPECVLECKVDQPYRCVTVCNRCITRVRNNAKNSYLLRHICLSVRPSARMAQVPPPLRPGKIFINFDIWKFFRNISRKFKFHYRLFSVKTNVYLWKCLAEFFLQRVFETNVVVKIPHIYVQ